VRTALLALSGRFLRHLRRGAVAYGVFLTSLLLTALAWYYVRENVRAQNEVRFNETVQAAQEAIDRRTDAYVDAMFGARGLFVASEEVRREEWAGYVRGIRPAERFEGLQALGYAEYIAPAEREEFVREAEEQGLPGLRPDLDPGGERPRYFPLAFVEPLDPANRSQINYDLYTLPEHRAAMNRARDDDRPVATSRTYVLTEAPPGSAADLSLKPGFAVYLPIYERGEPQETVEERRRALDGFVVGTFRMDGLLSSLLRGTFDPSVDFEVYDGQNMAESSLLYDDDGVRRAGVERQAPGYSSTTSTEVAGRQWTLYFRALPGFEAGAANRLPLFVLLSGVGISVLLFLIVWMLVRSRDHAERASVDLEDANRKLEGANQELEAFSYSVSHDLRAPLRTIDGFSRILQEDYGDDLDEDGKDYLGRVRNASQHMGNLIDDLLDLSRVTRSPLRREPVDLSAVAAEIAGNLKGSDPGRNVEFDIEPGLVAEGDANLLSVALENLLGNAWKFTSKKESATIEFGVETSGGETAYFVRDDGAGFDMAYAGKLFGAFQRLHMTEEFEGTGIGLATVQRIVHRHGGRVWAEGAVGRGATFYFTLGGPRQSAEAAPQRAEVA